MQWKTLAWPVTIILAAAMGFFVGRRWESRHHQQGPFGWMQPLGQHPYSPAPPNYYGGGPVPSGPVNPGPGLPDFNLRPTYDPALQSPSYTQVPPSAQPQTTQALPELTPPPATVAPPKLSAAGEAKVEDIRAIRDLIGKQLHPDGLPSEENAEAKLMFEDALRSVVAEEMAKTGSGSSAVAPASVEDSIVSPSLPPVGSFAAGEGPASVQLPSPATLEALAEPPPSIPAESPDAVQAPQGGGELRAAARMVEERAAKAEEAGDYERADALRLIAQALWQVARSEKK